MSVHVVFEEVQQWIQDSRLTLDTVDPELEVSAFSRVAGALALRYDTTAWTGTSTTPDLIRSIISMLIAAWTINRAHAETVADVDSYGVHLEQAALQLLEGLRVGDIVIGDTPGADSFATGSPAFFPTDASTQIAVDEGINADGATQLAFSMGTIF